jgi:hypothetical protein
MFTLEITEEQRAEAYARASKVDAIDGSLLGGDGKKVGSVGEIVFRDKFGGTLMPRLTYDYDILLNGKKLEIKAKTRSVVPKFFYSCTIQASSDHQMFDYLVFITVNKEHTIAYVEGYISREDFYKAAKLCPKGTRNNETGFIYEEDNYVCLQRDLKLFDGDPDAEKAKQFAESARKK